MNRFGIPAPIERRLRARDASCVYCLRAFGAARTDRPTIEHLNEKPPFHWRDGLREDGLALCCVSCNSSRGAKSLRAWFQTPYCTQRGITSETVAEPVRQYLDRAAIAELVK